MAATHQRQVLSVCRSADLSALPLEALLELAEAARNVVTAELAIHRQPTDDRRDAACGRFDAAVDGLVQDMARLAGADRQPS